MGRIRPHVTVVGLGPAGRAFMSNGVFALLSGPERILLRTERHPAAVDLDRFEALDHLYESADTFEEVYLAIVEVVVAAAIAHAPDPVVYAVPGSPLVAERTVELLRGDSRVDLTIVPGLSFLDLAWERLGVDPLSSGVRLVDAEHFSAQSAAERGPFLVAQCWSQSLLSGIKLSVPDEGDLPWPDVVLLHHLGLEDEQVIRVNWWEMDRTIAADHLTSLYIPELPAPTDVARDLVRLEDLVLTLRARCPWDRAQTHGSLMSHLVEESYEVLDALRELDEADSADTSPATEAALAAHLQEELGDLLFQIVFHARLAEEEGRFTLADVARGVHDKLVHRHPHVFGDVDADSAEQVVANWEKIKQQEKGRSSVTEGIPMNLPSLLLSTKLQRKAISVGLSDLDLDGDGSSIAETAAALEHAQSDRETPGPDAELSTNDAANVRLVGELLFAAANLARRLGIDPEQALRARALTFRDRVVAFEGA